MHIAGCAGCGVVAGRVVACALGQCDAVFHKVGFNVYRVLSRNGDVVPDHLNRAVFVGTDGNRRVFAGAGGNGVWAVYVGGCLGQVVVEAEECRNDCRHGKCDDVKFY